MEGISRQVGDDLAWALYEGMLRPMGLSMTNPLSP